MYGVVRHIVMKKNNPIYLPISCDYYRFIINKKGLQKTGAPYTLTG